MCASPALVTAVALASRRLVLPEVNDLKLEDAVLLDVRELDRLVAEPHKRLNCCLPQLVPLVH